MTIASQSNNHPDAIYRYIPKLLENGESGVVVTVIRIKGSVPRHAGSKMLVTATGDTIGTIGGGKLEADAIQTAETLLNAPEVMVRTHQLDEEEGMLCGGEVEMLYEPVGGAENLYIFGGGHVGQALAELTLPLGFQVTVIDDRPDYAVPERYPSGVNLLVDEFDSAMNRLSLDEKSYAVIVTYQHAHDGDILERCVGYPMKYIGMIGSQRKVNKTLQNLEERGISRESLQKVHSPVGLDIGAETPHEIAVSISAELIAVRRGADVGKMSMTL